MFHRRTDRDAACFALSIAALSAYAAGMPAAPSSIDTAAIVAGLNAAVSTIGADACASTPECVSDARGVRYRVGRL